MRSILAAILLVSAAAPASAADRLNVRKFGFYRVTAINTDVDVAAPLMNTMKIMRAYRQAAAQGASVVAFPELALTGYTAEDEFHNEDMLTEVRHGLAMLAETTRNTQSAMVVGAPYRAPDGRLFNAAFVIAGGRIIGAVNKLYLPNYAEFYENRWFAEDQNLDLQVQDTILGDFRLGWKQIFRIPNRTGGAEMRLGIEICEDGWSPIPPSRHLGLAGANVIVNLSGSNDLVGKAAFRRELVSQNAAAINAAYVYVSSGPTESTKDTVFGGHILMSENGGIISEGRRFVFQGTSVSVDIDVEKLQHERARNTTLGKAQARALITGFTNHNVDLDPQLADIDREYSQTPFVPQDPAVRNQVASEVLDIQAAALAGRIIERAKNLHSMGSADKRVNIQVGVSGGLDSTLALLVAVRAAGKVNEYYQHRGWGRYELTNIHGVTMPGFGTSERTRSSADDLMDALGIRSSVRPITDTATSMLEDIDYDMTDTENTAYGNAQARARTALLMNLGNKEGGFMLGTGDLSELILGWCTYNGDHMAMYGVNAGVPKTLVQYLVRYVADTATDARLKDVLTRILETKVSPELKPLGERGEIVESTEDALGPYILHDFFTYFHVRYGFSPQKIYYIARKTFSTGDFTYTPEKILQTLRTFYVRYNAHQMKRDTVPAAPKVGSVSISPRADMRRPTHTDGQCVAQLSAVDAMSAAEAAGESPFLTVPLHSIFRD